MANPDRINNRIVDREYKKNFLEGLEAAAIERMVSFSSPEMKRLFGRYFDITQRNIFMIEEICRVKLPHDMVAKAEAHLEGEIQKSINDVARDTTAGEELMKQNGIETLAGYTAKRLDRPIKIVSHISTMYLEVFERVDHLLTVVATLRLSRCITTEQQNFRRAQAKRVIRRLASVARMLFVGLRKRWPQGSSGDIAEVTSDEVQATGKSEVIEDAKPKVKGKARKTSEAKKPPADESANEERESAAPVAVEAG